MTETGGELDQFGPDADSGVGVGTGVRGGNVAGAVSNGPGGMGEIRDEINSRS